MPTMQENLAITVGKAGSNIGALAGLLRERMYQANALGEYEKAKAANALYQDYTFYAMKLGRIKIASIDESDEMKRALAAIRAVNKGLAEEKKRVKSLKNKIDGAAALTDKLEKVIGKLAELTA